MAFEDKFVPFWNKKFLEPPAMVSLKIKTKNPGQTSAQLAKHLMNIISVLENQDLLHFDAALISCLLFRTRKTLRNDKGYKGFQKVSRILKNYLLLDIIKVVSENRHASYEDKGPSKEMLEWCLVSLQRFSVLFNRLEKTCVETAYYLHNHITTGNRWHLAIMFLACLSRVWTFSRYFLLQICEWYSVLKGYLNCLESNELWLPLNYDLPDNIQSWLGNPDFLCKRNRNKILADKSATSEAPEKSNIVEGLLFNEDVGEIISRGSDMVVTSEREKIDAIKKPEDIEQFLRDEESYRSTNTKSLTSNLNETEWKWLRNSLRKCLKDITKAKDKKFFCTSMDRARQKLKLWLQTEQF